MIDGQSTSMYKTSIYHQTRLHNQKKKIITWYTCMSDGILDEGTLFNWAQIKTAYCKKKYITCEMSHSIRTFTLVSYLFYCINTNFYIQDITPIYKYYSIKLNKTYSVPQTYHLNLNTPPYLFWQAWQYQLHSWAPSENIAMLIPSSTERTSELHV